VDKAYSTYTVVVAHTLPQTRSLLATVFAADQPVQIDIVNQGAHLITAWQSPTKIDCKKLR
jgi:hypothetical protein